MDGDSPGNGEGSPGNGEGIPPSWVKSTISNDDMVAAGAFFFTISSSILLSKRSRFLFLSSLVEVASPLVEVASPLDVDRLWAD